MATTTPHIPSEPQVTATAQEAMTRMQLLLPDAVETLRRNLTSGDPAIEVSAAHELLDRALMPKAAYSFKGHLSNQTDYTLTLAEKTSSGGKWTTNPPPIVAPGGSAFWSGEYDGFYYFGRVAYRGGPNDGVVKMRWDIPLFGDNTIDQSTNISGTTVSHEGGRGWHAEVWWRLRQLTQA
jgi:hypothetical protein